MEANIGPQRSPSSVGRIEAQRKAIQRELDAMDAEDTFVCSRCGTATVERDRSGDSSECIYC